LAFPVPRFKVWILEKKLGGDASWKIEARQRRSVALTRYLRPLDIIDRFFITGSYELLKDLRNGTTLTPRKLRFIAKIQIDRSVV
jgi:hypothetical protein